MAGYGLRRLAQQDLKEIWHYSLEQWGLEQAERYLDALFSCFDDLADNPQMGRPRDDILPGIRSFPQGRHLIFYDINDQGIEIIGIIHQTMDVALHLDSGLSKATD